MLVVFATHPVQYAAPVFRYVQQSLGVPVTVIYESDFSVVGYRDKDFGATFKWDVDLTSGYRAIFLHETAKGAPVPSTPGEQGTFREIWRALAETNASAVLITGYGTGFYRAAIVATKLRRLPTLVRSETSDILQTRSPLRRVARDTALRLFYSGCAAALYVGKLSRQHYERLGVPGGRLFFSPYCVNTDNLIPFADQARVRAETRTRLGFAADDIVIAFAGKLEPRKGVVQMPAALKLRPPEERARLRVLIIGSGPLEASLRDEFSAAGIRAHFAGFQNQKAIGQYYCAADLFALPSRYETWGLVVNEALHHGLPVVVSDMTSSGPDLVESGVTGEVFVLDSASSLSEALGRAWKLAGRPEIAAACRARAEAYSVAAAAQGIFQAYNAVTKGISS